MAFGLRARPTPRRPGWVQESRGFFTAALGASWALLGVVLGQNPDSADRLSCGRPSRFTLQIESAVAYTRRSDAKPGHVRNFS
jgi:hypothetical protein